MPEYHEYCMEAVYIQYISKGSRIKKLLVDEVTDNNAVHIWLHKFEQSCDTD